MKTRLQKSATMMLAATVMFAVGLGSAHAGVIAHDNFNYLDGSLVPNGGWANHSGTVGDLQVVSGQAIVQHGVPSEDANLGFTGASGNIYFGIDFSVSASGVITGGDYEYFTHFSDGGSSNFRARVDIVEPSGGGDFSVGISTTASLADATWPADLTFGVTYRAVVRYDQDANIAELWIDAALESDPSILGADVLDPGLACTAVCFRQSDSSLNETVTVDNLCIGTTFADVVAPCEDQPIPVEPSTWGAIKARHNR